MIDVLLEVEGQDIGGTENILEVDPGAVFAGCEMILPPCANPDFCQFFYRPEGCTLGLDCVGVRAVILSFVTPISDDAILYSCDVEILDAGAAPCIPLRCSDAAAVDFSGDPVLGVCAGDGLTECVSDADCSLVGGPCGCVSGHVCVETPLSATATPTEVPATPTLTPSGVPPTPSSTAATPFDEDDSACQIAGAPPRWNWELLLGLGLLVACRAAAQLRQ